MITVKEIVLSIVKNSPLIEDGLNKGLINYSAFARIYKNQIEKKLLKPVQRGAIVVALRRIAKDAKNHTYANPIFEKPLEIIVRSNLFELTIKHTPSLSLMQQLGTLKNKPDNYFLTLTEGIFESTIIASSELKNEIISKVSKDAIIFELDNLSAITVRLPKVSLFTPGVFYTFLKHLAWENINVIEMVSTTYEDSFILEEKDVDRAFVSLKNLFKSLQSQAISS
jgi:hypothetical protein